MRILDSGEVGRPTLVLIHGLASSSDCWRRVQRRLAKGRRLVTVDLFTRRVNRFSIEGSARELAAELSRRGIVRADVIGHSLGGLVAAALAQSSSIVERLVLVAMPSERRRGGGWRRFAGMVGSLRRTELSAVALVVASSLRSSPLALLAATRATLSADPETLAPRPGLPTLLVWGSDDPIVPLAEGLRLRDRIRGSSLVVLPGIGHQPMWDDPGSFIAAVRPFLAAAEAAA